MARIPAEDFLDEKTRAEDILLGSLGFDADAKLISIEPTSTGYKGRACWITDGEEFFFESDDSIDDMQKWALKVLITKSSGK